MKLPTVKLKHRRTGEIKIVNQTDYARDVTGNSDWKIITLQRGDAPDDVVDFARRQSDKTLHRRLYSKYGKGDRDRAFAERSMAGTNIEATPVSFTDGDAIKVNMNNPVQRAAVLDAMDAIDMIDPLDTLAAMERVATPDPPKRKRGRPRKNKE